MKAKIPHQFFLFASNFSIKSMIESVAFCAFDLYNNPSPEFDCFAKQQDYTINLNGRLKKQRTLLVQTWLIDLIYNIACLKHKSSKQISKGESIYLIALHNDLSNIRDGERIKTSINDFN